MAFQIEDYCRRFQEALLAEFGKNVCYIGLQGSYLRGEATDKSDIDMMVILETLTIEDMDMYRRILSELGDENRACGFICSKAEMQNWNPLEACQLRYTTKDIHGTLTDFLPEWTMQDEVHYVQMSLNNLYHALCHGYLHRSIENLRAHLLPHYKSAYFILQNTHFLETGEFILPKAELVQKLQGADRSVLETLLQLSGGAKIEFECHYTLLFNWCKQKMAGIRA